MIFLMEFNGKRSVTAAVCVHNNVKKHACQLYSEHKSVSTTIKSDVATSVWISPVYCGNSNTSFFQLNMWSQCLFLNGARMSSFACLLLGWPYTYNTRFVLFTYNTNMSVISWKFIQNSNMNWPWFCLSFLAMKKLKIRLESSVNNRQ